MSNVKACRFCLITDVRMEDITGTLGDNIVSIFGRNMFYSPDLPPYVCYECAVLVVKFNKFKNKNLLVQSILYDMIHDFGEVTEEAIKNLDRDTLKLKSNLSQISLEVTQCREGSEDVRRHPDATEGILLEMVVNGESSDDDYVLSTYASKHSNPKEITQENQSSKTEIEPFEPTTENITNAIKQTVKQAGPDDDLLNDFVITKLTKEDQIAEITKRRESSYYKNSTHKCNICYKGFLQVQTLQDHLIRHADCSGDIVCDVCKFRFNTRRAYSMHAVKHTKKYACNKCNFVTVHTQKAKKHKQWHEGVTYMCGYCNEVSSKMTSHLSHIRLKHTTQFVCEVCGYSFVSLKGVKMHNSRMHRLLPQDKRAEVHDSAKKQDPNVYCRECELHFSSKEAGKRHVLTSAKHRDNLGSGCRHCGEVFPSASSLRAHQRVHARRRHTNKHARSLSAPAAVPQRYPAHCDHCDELIPNRSRHWKHYQRHHKDKKYPPSASNYMGEICGKGFQSNAFLANHARAHAAERARACGRCPGPAAFACTICCNTFNTRLGLYHHFRNHSGIRPFPCQYCGMTFLRGTCLTQHVKHIHLRPVFTADKSHGIED